MTSKYILLLSFVAFSISALAQSGKISGQVAVAENSTPYVTISVTELTRGALTNEYGKYTLSDMPYGTYTITASYIGYQAVAQTVTLTSAKSEATLDFSIKETKMDLDGVVVTGTKTHEYKSNSPVLVSTVTGKMLENVQACDLAEGLKFQPGLRVENNCQTCNYTQLRMNGLAGGYSQILINGRPIFSPLTGLYGMEQLPTNMIERIEVVRGGGSSLYGSSAVGGTVNVITKLPTKNSYSLDYSYQQIGGQANDHQLRGNTSVIAPNEKSGLSIFLNKRQRDFYDHNDDNFSELSKIENTSVGVNAFFLPKENQKLEFSISNLNEYRFGGEMVDKPAYLTQQSEERTHNVWMGSADYQLNSKDQKTSLISYAAWQHTTRDHYTGIKPDSGEALQQHLENSPYGVSNVSTYNAGIQVNHKVDKFLTGANTLTLGTEYIWDEVFDKIPAYNYLVDQTTKNTGVFVQSNWEVLPKVRLLSGVRIDAHNLIDNLVFSPRASLLYKPLTNMQLRVNYGAGFRAPQAFDTDLHIAFAGGGISRVRLSPDLAPERSQSLSSSISYDRSNEDFIIGFTLEGFYTHLDQAFFLQPVGEDAFGEVFVKQNGQGATVQGATLELRANYDKKVQLESGFTLQTSRFDEAVQYIDNVAGIRDFIRTPNQYGFSSLTFTPTNKLNATVSYVYTGSMQVPHFAGAPNQEEDEIITSETFSELNAKISYRLNKGTSKTGIELYVGTKNVLNAYQNSFDIGKNRDSNFVYGPAMPRSFFIGVKLSSF
jgi:outer membrane receptor for ferrienterochelin and colicins